MCDQTRLLARAGILKWANIDRIEEYTTDLSGVRRFL